MSAKSEKILLEAIGLPPTERAELIEQLLASFEFPSRESIDRLWAAEAEDRIDSYEKGELAATPVREVFEKLNRK